MKQEKETHKIEFQGNLELERAIGYLEEALRSMKEGAFSVECGDRQITFKPSPVVGLEIEAKQKDDKQELSIELTWRAGLKASEDAGFRICSLEKAREPVGLTPSAEDMIA